MSEITLRDGTVVRHFFSKSERQRDYWEVEYPDGERVREMTDKPLDWRESARILDEKWADHWPDDEDDPDPDLRQTTDISLLTRFYKWVATLRAHDNPRGDYIRDTRGGLEAGLAPAEMEQAEMTGHPEAALQGRRLRRRYAREHPQESVPAWWTR